jgi:hypothetical protein
MTTRSPAIVLLVLMLAAPAQTQSLSELMEKAIYTEEMLGNTEGAIRLYQQIISGSVPDTEIRQEAQRRLDLARANLKTTPRVPLGTFDGHTYRHTRTQSSFTVPARWVVTGTHPSSDDGEMARITATEPEADVSVWMIREANDAQSIDRKLSGSPAMKLSARRHLPNYRYRPDSLQRRVINGKQAMTAIAEFGVDMPYVEYLTWIYTEKTHTLFLATIPAADFPRFQPVFDDLLSSTDIP